MGKWSFLREYKLLSPIMRWRDYIMTTLGLFYIKQKIKHYFFLVRIQIEDKKKKKKVARLIMLLPNNLIKGDFNRNDFVFSLTSYGTRVEDTLPYALYSIINQELPPRKIVVYLDNNNWSDEKLNPLLKKLKMVGVDFRYCKDIRSYKKLLPAIKDFPNNPIITLDDDFYYNENYHTWMRNAFDKSDKKTVLGQWACIPQVKNGKYLPYSQWIDCKYMQQGDEISFFGCCCCYPPNIFDEEIFNEEIFMKLCPTADDIWFWAMEKRRNIKRELIEPHGYGLNISINRIEQYDFSIKGTLMYENVIQGANDKQLLDVISLYELRP